MRMWIDRDGRLLTDEQLLRLVAYKGSLEEALKEKGDIRLVSSGGDRTSSTHELSSNEKPSLRAGLSKAESKVSSHRKLVDYLKEDESHGE